MSQVSLANLNKLLEDLRDYPEKRKVDHTIIQPVWDYITKVPNGPNGERHWFCSLANETTIEAATFLIRLLAFSGDEVDNWRRMIHECLSLCVGCVFGCEAAKERSRHTYLANYPPESLNIFFTTFAKMEVEHVEDDIKAAQEAGTSVTDATLYRIVTNWPVFIDPKVQEYLHTRPPTSVSEGWPQPLGPGLMLLLASDDANLRQWARGHATRARMIGPNDINASYQTALDILLWGLKGCPTDGLPVKSPPPLATNAELWAGVYDIFRLLPPAVFDSGVGLEMKRIILGHLNTTNPEFQSVFKSFILLTKRLGDKLWAGEGPEYPGTVFDAIISNPIYISQIQSLSQADAGSFILSWFQEFLATLRNSPSYASLLNKVINFFCEDTQAESFLQVRPTVLKIAISILKSEFKRPVSGSAGDAHRKSVSDIVDLHAGTLTDLAFGIKYKGAQWQSARELARAFIQEILHEDVECVKKTIEALPLVLGKRRQDKTKAVTLPVFLFRKKLWPAMYATLQGNITLDAQDVQGLGDIIVLVSRVSYFAKITTSVYTDHWGKLPAGDALLVQINEALSAMHQGLSGAVSAFTEYGNSSNGIDFFQSEGVAKAVMTLLLSPVEEFQTASKTLIGLAFDADGRSDCIRAMLENLPVASFDGMFRFLEKFEHYATMMPEACTLSASVVLCFADVLEVMCTSPDGLVHRTLFLRPNDDNGPAARLPQFWKRLNGALTVIYKRTPMWAEVMEAADMLTWMRDAMILARDALREWRVIEQAANAYCKAEKQAKPGKVSPIGRQMINSFQTFMPEVVKWLRLTNQELLFQSFSLLGDLLELMKDLGIQPTELVLSKCLKYVRGKSTTKLDQGRITQLSEKLAYFEEEEVEIVGHKPAPEKKPVASSSKAPSKATPTPAPSSSASSSVKSKSKVEEQPKARNYIQGHPSGSARTSSKLQVQQRLPFKSSPIVYSDDDMAPTKFTDRDQQRLAAATAATRPSFRKTPAVPPVAGPSKVPGLAHRMPRKSDEPKNEAFSSSAASQSEATTSGASDESDDDDDDDIPDLANYGKVKSPMKPKPVVRRQIKTIDMPTRNVRRVERAPREKDWASLQTQRIRPNIGSLHKMILSWSYQHEGELPPGPPLVMSKVPQRFNDYDHYFRVFQPLLLAECWTQIQEDKGTPQESFQCKVESRHYDGDFAEVDMSISESVTSGWYLSETDIVLLKQPGNSKCTMAKVVSYREQRAGIQLHISFYCPGGARDPGLQVSTVWQVSKVFSLSTVNREYAALLSLQYNKIQSFIFNPSLPQPPEVDEKAIVQVMETYRLNKPQASAILKASATEGFSLIQGPPGTGKTSTTTALISRFLSQKNSARVEIVVGRASEPAPPPRVLVCAPSNAAVDELVQRLRDANIVAVQRGTPASIVRIGTQNSIGVTVRDLSLDSLVEEKLDSVSRPPLGDIGNEISEMVKELKSIKAERTEIINKMREATGPAEASLKVKSQELQAKQIALSGKLDMKRDKQKSESRSFDAARRNARLEILNKSDIVCATLSGAGHESIDMLTFDMIVIDEAAQAIELSSLIPLRFGCPRVVMVGDPQQLPPTVKSKQATQYGYNESLFVRLQRSRQESVHLLSIQYRMHPDISCLPSRVFYDNRLLDGPDMATKTLQPWHATKQFGTYKFFNVAGTEEAVGTGVRNTAECVIAVEIFRALSKHYKSMDFSARVGIITMYRAQLEALTSMFANKFGRDVAKRIHFGTVDGFQGQEKDIIILSCVRSGTRSTNIGFLTDVRRMNVALTRAKSSLFILGNAPTLERSDKTWAEIVKDAKTRSTLIDVNAQYFAGPLTAQTPAPSQAPTKKRKVEATPETPLPMPDLFNPRDMKKIKTSNSSQPSSSMNQSKTENSTSAKTPPSSTPMEVDSRQTALPDTAPNGQPARDSAPNIPSSTNGAPVLNPEPLKAPNPPSAGPSATANPASSASGPPPGPPPRPAPPKKRKAPPAMDMFIPKKKKR